MKRTLWCCLAFVLYAGSAFAADKIVIISPHRKSIQDEFIPKFKEYYKATYKTDVDVDWLDQGGTSDDVRFLHSKFEKTPATSGVDVFWGGGTSVYMDMSRDKLLASYQLPATLAKQVPETVGGVTLYDKTHTWYAAAMSSFGIFYNKKIVQMDGLPTPQSWSDLGLPKFKNELTLADPRRSGSANTMNMIILQSLGWDKGWELLTRISANTRQFTQSSSDPIKAVVSGDAAAAMAIDFYATPKVASLGTANLGFALPKEQTVLDPDPIAIIKGAPHRQVAERFVQYVLSPDAQKLLILPKGQKDGPRLESLGRMAVNSAAYDQTEGRRMNPFNPFKQKNVMKLDVAKTARMERVFNDMVGAVLVDTHADLMKAWAAVIKRGAKPADVQELGRPPVTEAEMLKLADKWDNDILRNKTINNWVRFAKTKYAKLATK